MLALPSGENHETIVFSNFSLKTRVIEPAGKYFEEYITRRLNDNYLEEEQSHLKAEDLNDNFDDDLKNEYEWEAEYYESLRTNNQNLLNSVKENFYSILGLDDVFMSATENDIRKAYKRLVVKYHPDKHKEEVIEVEPVIAEDTEHSSITVIQSQSQNVHQKTNAIWLKIQEAYETLIDEDKRKKYNCSFEFDETIPEDQELSDDKFFKTYGPCFLKNSIWAKKKPCPKLGDIKTPIDKVRRFYKFWLSFESWRDFNVDGEYDLQGRLIT